MLEWFISLPNSDKIELFSIVTSLATSIIAIVISVKTLKQSSNAIVESSRANIVFYIDTLTGGQQFLTVKNFGNSVGEILSVNISPKLDYSNHPKMPKKHNPVLIDYKGILLAPSQCVKSWFPFSEYPDKVFDIHIEYKTLGKIYKADYPINLSYIEAIDYIYKTPLDVKNETSALIDIGNTLRRISEK